MAADLSMQLAWKGTARYEVLGCLGQGGMGIVYQVFYRQRCERVALKSLLHFVPSNLCAEPLIEKADLSREVRKKIPAGVDGVLEIVGTSTLLDSFKMVRYRGRVAMAGFLGGLAPLTLDPLMQMPSGMQFSFFASAFLFGEPDFPVSLIPFRDFVARAERGVYRAAPAHVFDFEQVVDAHRLVESGKARGKIVVRGAR
jgi:NADPH:quinone reductase-like Zn-dependent oxidoreductase